MAETKQRNIWGGVFQALLIIVGAALSAESLLAVSMTAKLHLGIIMPFIIGFPLFLVGVFYKPICRLSEKYRLVRILKYCMIAVYVAFFLLFGVTTALILINSAEPQQRDIDAVIVLGAGIRGNAPSATLAYRLDKAAALYREDPSLSIIVSGGRGQDEVTSEASVMRARLISLGVPESSIIMEDRSTSTEENFVFSMELVASDKERFGSEPKLAFVTSRFHVFRAERIAKKLGIEAVGFPAREYKPLILNNYLRECAAIVQYFLTGRM